MPITSDIISSANYGGQAQLGQGLGVGITIDSSPLQKLATFNYYSQRDKWEQQQKENVLAASKIAAMSAFDITSPFTQYSDDLKSSLSELQKFVKDNPDSLVYSKDPKKYQEREEKINAFMNKRKVATINDTLYNADKARIEQIADPTTRDIEKRKLDVRAKKLFADGLDPAYNKQFEATPPPKPSDSIIPTIGITTRDTFIKLPNDNVTTQVTYGDPDELMAKATMRAAGSQEVDITKENWFKRLTPDEQQIELEQSKAPSTQRKAFENTALGIKSLFDQWQAANPAIDINTVDVSELPNDSFGKNIRSARAINSQIDELNSLVLQGGIKDPSGKVRSVPYEKINLKDGLSPAELIFMASIQDSKTPLIQKVDKTVQNTDDALQRQNQLLDFQAAWASANKPSGGNPMEKAIENPAILFGAHIDRLKSNLNKNKTDKVIVSYEATDENTRKALGISPTSGGDPKEYVTYFADGTYRIGTDKKGVGGNPGTIEQLRQGFINTVKSGLSADGTQTEGFQTNAENGFVKVYGVNDGKTIWDKWGVKQQAAPSATQPSSAKEIKKTDISTKAAAAGYSEKEYRKLLTDKGIKIID